MRAAISKAAEMKVHGPRGRRQKEGTVHHCSVGMDRPGIDGRSLIEPAEPRPMTTLVPAEGGFISAALGAAYAKMLQPPD